MMNSEEINKMKKRSTTMLKILNIVTWGAGIFLFALIILLIWSVFLPQEAFHAEKGVDQWEFGVSPFANISFNSLVSFTILQGLSTDMFEAKTAYIIFTLFNTVTSMVVFLYGITQVKNMLLSVIDSHTPFMSENAVRLRNLSFVMIGYGLLGGLLVNVAIILFVTHIFSMNPLNINFSGLIIGVLLLILSQIFKYGAYLQEEVDTTL